MLSLSKHVRWAGLLALASCSPAAESELAGDPIACALDRATDFTPTCRGESEIVPGGTILIVRHPDGGFRRFEIEGDWVRTADGVDLDAAAIVVRRDATEVTVGTDRYRLLPPPPPVDAPRP